MTNCQCCQCRKDRRELIAKNIKSNIWLRKPQTWNDIPGAVMRVK